MFWLVCLLVVSSSTIINTPGVLYSIRDESISSSVMTIVNYGNVIIQNCTFQNSSLTVNNSYSIQSSGNVFVNTPSLYQLATNMTMNENTFIGHQAYSTVTLDRILSSSIYGNIWHASMLQGNSCSTFKTEIEFVPSSSYSTAINFTRNIYYNQGYNPTSLFRLNSTTNMSFTSVTFDYNLLNLTKTDPFTHYVNWCYISSMSNLTNSAKYYQTPFYFGIGVNPVTQSFKFNYNTLNIIGTGSTSKTLHSSTNYTYDSLFLLIGSPSVPTGGFENQGNQVNLIGNYGSIYAPVRVTSLYLQNSLTNIKTMFNINLSTVYQYVPNYLNTLNPNSNAYTFNTQIEPSYSDEYFGWDECHNACKRHCDQCIYTDDAYIGQEFSTYVDDICFNRQLFGNITKAARLCRHENLKITNPIVITDSVIFTSKNKVNGKLIIGPRYSGNVTFSLTSSNTVDNQYRYTLDRTKFVTNPFDASFSNNHPNLLVLQETVSVDDNGQITNLTYAESGTLSYLKFSNVVMRLRNTDLTTSVLSIQMDSPISGSLPTFIMDNCVVDAYNEVANQFIAGFPFIRSVGEETYYTRSIVSFGNITVTNSTFKRIDRFYDNDLSVGRFEMRNTYKESLQNGFLAGYGTDFVYSDNTCSNCFTDSATGMFIKFTGNMADSSNSSQFLNNIFTSTTTPSILFKSTFNFTNFNYFNIRNNVATQTGQVGLYYSNLGNYRCNYFTLLELEFVNNQLNGTVFDFYCDPLGIGCRKDTCYEDLSIAPPFCVVNKTYPTDNFYYKLVYFTSIQQAIDRCTSYPNRTIYVTKDVYQEALSFRNRHPINESLWILPLYEGQRPIIVESSHTISSTSVSFFNISLFNMDFINPLGLTSYTSSRTSNMLSTSDSNTGDIRLDGLHFYAIQPYLDIASLPTTYAAWDNLRSQLVQRTNVTPNLRAPNTNTIINVQPNYNSYYQNLRLYGSEAYGIRETRLRTYRTTIENTYGENHWSSYITLSSQWSLSVTGNNCSEFCGGQMPTVAAVFKADFSSGKRFIFSNNYFDSGRTPSGNIYVTSRFPYGSPFINGFGGFGGRLAATWILGMQNATNWEAFQWRNNLRRGYSFADRFTSCGDDVMALNDAVILYTDARRVPRQIQYENDYTNSAYMTSGTVHDVKIGGILEDDFDTSSNYCDDLCPVSVTEQYCTVNPLSTLTTSNYQNLTSAIANCIYPTIIMMNATHYEDVTSNLVYSFRTGTTLTIRSSTGTTIIGNHNLNQDCGGSDLVPTELILMGITIQPRVAGSPAIKITPDTSCSYPKLTFSGLTFQLANSSATGTWDGIVCQSCNVRNITIQSSTFSTGFSNAIILDGTSSAVKPWVTLTSNTLQLSRQIALSLITLDYVEMTGNTISCNSDTTGVGCWYIYGIQATRSNLNGNTIRSNVGSSVKYNAITWNLAGAYSFGGVINQTIGLVSTTTSASRFGLQIISNDIDSNYPCVSSTPSSAYIRTIRVRNPNIDGNDHDTVITDESGVILGYITAGSNTINCFVDDGLDPDPNVMFYTIVGLTIFLIVIVILFLFGCRVIDCVAMTSMYRVSNEDGSVGYIPLSRTDDFNK